MSIGVFPISFRFSGVPLCPALAYFVGIMAKKLGRPIFAKLHSCLNLSERKPPNRHLLFYGPSSRCRGDFVIYWPPFHYGKEIGKTPLVSIGSGLKKKTASGRYYSSGARRSAPSVFGISLEQTVVIQGRKGNTNLLMLSRDCPRTCKKASPNFVSLKPAQYCEAMATPSIL